MSPGWQLRCSQMASREEKGGGQAEKRTLRLAPVAVKAREKMTARELMEAARDHQAGIALEGELRRVAREQGLNAEEAGKLAEATRAGFRRVNGEPIPVEVDRVTVLLGPDGVNVLTGRRRGRNGTGPSSAFRYTTWLPI
jgi:hypothetical protein